MGELTTGVSWLAVIIGAVVSFLVGWLWYSPKLFGEKWAVGSRVELGDASDMPVSAMVAQGLGLLLMSWFVSLMAANGLLGAMILGTIAFTVLAYSGNTFSQKTSYARNVDAGYWIVALAIMIIINSIF